MRNFLRVILEQKNGGQLSQYLAVLSANILIFLNGIHVGWPSPSLRKIFSQDYPFTVTEDEGSYIVIISYIGDVIGGICGCSLINVIGRKNTLLSITIPYILSFLLISFSNYGTIYLYFARVLGGISEGATFAVVPLYAAEVADPDIRGKLGTFQLAVLTFGQIFVNVITESLEIHTVSKICLIFPILFALIFSQMPETPYYLLTKKKKMAAMDSLIILRRSNDVGKELEVLENDVHRQQSEQGGFKELFTIPSNRKAFILANVTRVVQQFAGTSALGAYFQIIIANASENISPMLGTTMILIVQATLNMSLYYFIDLYDRKKLLVLSSALTAIILFLFSGFLILRDFTSLDTTSLNFLPIAMIFFFIISFNIGLGPIPNVLTAEMYSTSIKAKATALSSLTLSLSMMGTIKFYQYTADNISMAVPFLTFTICTFFGTFFFRFFLIETRGKTLEMIQKELLVST